MTVALMQAFFCSKAQESITLAFTGRDTANHYVQLNRVVVKNLTKKWKETLVWPDTVLTLNNLHDGSMITLKGPNPFSGSTSISVNVKELKPTTLTVYDLSGNSIVHYSDMLAVGEHVFNIQLNSAQIFLLRAENGSSSHTVKLINKNAASNNNISYSEKIISQFASSHISTHLFTIGDKMEFVGYANDNDIEMESGNLIQNQNVAQTIKLEFAGKDCVPYVTDYDGNQYKAVFIGSQCWMKENLRTRHFTDGFVIATGPYPLDYYESYRPFVFFPLDNSAYAVDFGCLYNFGAVSGNHFLGYKAICPTGWHVPKLEEWNQLFNYTKQNNFVCGEDDNNIAKAISATFGWEISENECAVGNDLSSNNATSFSAISTNASDGAGTTAKFWSNSSSYSKTAMGIFIENSKSNIIVSESAKQATFSVRCVRN